MNNELEENIKSSKVIYEIVRGSNLHGTATKDSDIDIFGVFIAKPDEFFGLPQNYKPQYKDEKGDKIYYEFGRFCELLLNSNPNILEALFAPEKFIISCDDVMKLILENKKEFLSKDALFVFEKYAIEQIIKAKGYNKLCSYPENMERQQPIDFCYTFNGYQGTISILKWLEQNGLKQIYCGLNHLPNMNLMHGVFYDWGQHLHMEFKSFEEYLDYELNNDNLLTENICYLYSKFLEERHLPETHDFRHGEEFYQYLKPKGYHGIVKTDGSSCDVHLDSILKGDHPICLMSYNEDGYQAHCKQYNGWLAWKKCRNEKRYISNFGQGYDAKNMSECIRLLRMAVELAETGEFNIDRSKVGDAQYLLDIKEHKYKYEELLEEANKLKEKLHSLIPSCTLPKHVNKDLVNEILINTRKMYYYER